MDFALTEEQKVLVQGLRDMLTKEYDKAYFRNGNHYGVAI